MTTIGLIRHGLTDWNIEQKAQGQTDIPLNEIGRKQAEVLATRFQEREWDVIVTSPLSRAADTAKAVAKKIGAGVIEDHRLQERGFGEVEGTTEMERIHRFGENWRELDLGREAIEAVTRRSVECVEEFCYSYEGKRILFVSHGATLNMLIKGLLEDPHFDERFDNTAFSVFEKIGNQWDCQLLNCTKHLHNQKEQEVIN
ncbi:Broad specificity phosphatase PhoE [Salinibacillus kushneri]|uniref:Broad specificity phosphatase PhoE n=1 Tax=Salinibacillus kushneri TaxID=237682 RepID=A0A1I0IR61_9BACI|nr:histidine phosphatase family protein [Salinibacillus kushneri]SET98973.1 Broad specificity phosphatase PhoE [Salinibacillus kushneri]